MILNLFFESNERLAKRRIMAISRITVFPELVGAEITKFLFE